MISRLLVGAILAWQQMAGWQAPSAPVTLTIKVIDSATSSGIPNATVRVVGLDTLHTNAVGVCQAELPTPGRFEVLPPEAEGYRSPPKTTAIIVKPGSGPLALTVSLSRSATFSGRIVDGNLGNPLAGVSVRPLLAEYVRGYLSVRTGAAPTATTDVQGNFVLGELVAGDYKLELHAKGYPLTHWPGDGLQDPITINAPSGSFTSLGSVELRRSELPSVNVTVTGGNCHQGQFYNLELLQSSLTSIFSRAKVACPCGGVATFESVSPGAYEIRVEAPWEALDRRQRGVSTVQVIDRDAAIEIPVTLPIPIYGKLRLEESGDLPPDIRVRAWPSTSRIAAAMVHIGATSRSKATADGSFRTAAYIPTDGVIDLDVLNLPWAYYCKEIHYENRVFEGSTFAMDPGVARQQVEVVLSSGAVAITGTVRTTDGKTAVDTQVLLTPWPARVASNYPSAVREASTDSGGAFFFAGLSPGVYRLIAVPSAIRPGLENPGRMLALFEAADSFEVVKRGVAMKNLTIK